MDSIREKYSAPYMGTERERNGMIAAEVMAAFEIESSAVMALDDAAYHLARADYYSAIEGADQRAHSLSARLHDPERYGLPIILAQRLARFPAELAIEFPLDCDEPVVIRDLILNISSQDFRNYLETRLPDDLPEVIAEMVSTWIESDSE